MIVMVNIRYEWDSVLRQGIPDNGGTSDTQQWYATSTVGPRIGVPGSSGSQNWSTRFQWVPELENQVKELGSRRDQVVRMGRRKVTEEKTKIKQLLSIYLKQHK